MFELAQVFSESCGHQSLCSIHVIKSTHPNFEHTKFEPDISNHARKKWGVKIQVDCRTPCRFVLGQTKQLHVPAWVLLSSSDQPHTSDILQNFQKEKEAQLVCVSSGM